MALGFKIRMRGAGFSGEASSGHPRTAVEMNIRVECYSGHRGEEIPRAMWFGDRRVEVAEIIDRWLAPDHRYFKLLGADRCLYIIRHDIVTFDWQITFYQNPAIANASDGGPLPGNA